MFVFTAKVSKARLTAGLICIIVLAAVLVLVFSGRGEAAETTAKAEKPGLSLTAKTGGDRVKLLTGLGWLVDENPVETETVVIPKEFGDVYEKYNELQLAQGFDLTKYAGLEATRYTYRVLNHPSGDAVADMIVYRGRVIAGDVQNVALGGEMERLIPAQD